MKLSTLFEKIKDIFSHPVQESSRSTMRTYIEEGNILCKISQSRPGLSRENNFIEYNPGKITKAEGPNGILSFTTLDHALICCLYGDQLTMIEMNRRVLGKNLLNMPVTYIGHEFNEMRTKRLMIHTIYSVNDPKVFKELIRAASHKTLFNVISENATFKKENTEKIDLRHFETRLCKNGCDIAADLFRYLYEKYRWSNWDKVANAIQSNLDNDYDEWRVSYQERYGIDPETAFSERTDQRQTDIDAFMRDISRPQTMAVVQEEPEPDPGPPLVFDQETGLFVEPELIAQEIEFQKALEAELLSEPQATADEEERAESYYEDYDEPER